jgi:hypothetical protein
MKRRSPRPRRSRVLLRIAPRRAIAAELRTELLRRDLRRLAADACPPSPELLAAIRARVAAVLAAPRAPE